MLEFKFVGILVPVFFLKKPSKPVVPKVCSADPKGSASSSQGIHGYIFVMAILKFDILLKIVAQIL
jgi:hypothetical protein